MELKHIVVLALQVSIFFTVFGFGLRTTVDDLMYLIRRPGLLLRSLLAVFVIMPVIAVILVRLFDFRHVVEVALVALAISPVPPLLPRRELKAGGQDSYGFGLMAILALLSIAVIPLAGSMLERVFGHSLSVAPGAVAMLAFKTVLLPLAVGMIVHAAFPQLAEKIAKSVALGANVLLSLAGIVFLVAVAPALWALVGEGTLVAMTVFAVAGLIIGHFMGGPEPSHSVVLALSSACRHPAIAMAVAAAAFPHEHFGAPIILHLLVGIVIGIPYIAYVRKSADWHHEAAGHHVRA
jgi:BASS family bile acid:Na+ symporter